MDDAKQQLLEKLKSSSNILVTVSRNPSVDQLASCIGLTLLLNKQGKHAAAVFSGKPPSTLEFLKPDDTLEKNTDSLRDFIISLDKAKADKLRYKVEEDVVRIFITPYKTSLSQADLEFSEGDFNVDVVVALGVREQEELDEAITAHGRILHDATVASINTSSDGGLGTINWHDPQASSLSELVTDLAQALDADLLDSQIATALLTGIVSETGRFSNDKTSSLTMSASAALMAAGANQQLVATKLEAGASGTSSTASDDPSNPDQDSTDREDGVLEIDHAAGFDDDTPQDDTSEDKESPAANEAPSFDNLPSETGLPGSPEPKAKPNASGSALSAGPKLMTEPPTLGGTLTANSESEGLDPVTDPFSLPSNEPPQMFSRKDEAPSPTKDTPPAGSTISPMEPVIVPDPPKSVPEPVLQILKPAPPTWTPPQPRQPASAPGSETTNNVTLSDLEQSVGSPHATPQAELDSVRDEVSQALSSSESTDPIEALNAQPLGSDLHPASAADPDSQSPPPLEPPTPAAGTPAPTPPPVTPAADPPQVTDPNAPPPVPPPIPFQFGNSPPPQ